MNDTETLRLQCPHCDKRLRAPARAAGKTVRCPYCTRSVSIPAQAGTGDKSVQPNAHLLPWQKGILPTALGLVVVGAMYLAAFFLPAFQSADGTRYWSGWEAFALWEHGSDGSLLLQLNWATNPLFWLAFLLFAIDWRREALVAGLLAVPLGSLI
jgi:hypothetical protein